MMIDKIKTIDLLKFALQKNGVDSLSYFIGSEGDEEFQDGVLCLLEGADGRWIILYIERGLSSCLSWYSDLHDAVTSFYWKLTRVDTPWEYREDWEVETGRRL